MNNTGARLAIRIVVDRNKWVVIPDGRHGSGGGASEVGRWELPNPDLVPMLRNDRKLVVDILDRLVNVAILSMNHLYSTMCGFGARS